MKDEQIFEICIKFVKVGLFLPLLFVKIFSALILGVIITLDEYGKHMEKLINKYEPEKKKRE